MYSIHIPRFMIYSLWRVGPWNFLQNSWNPCRSGVYCLNIAVVYLNMICISKYPPYTRLNCHFSGEREHIIIIIILLLYYYYYDYYCYYYYCITSAYRVMKPKTGVAVIHLGHLGLQLRLLLWVQLWSFDQQMVKLLKLVILQCPQTLGNPSLKVIFPAFWTSRVDRDCPVTEMITRRYP